MTLRRLKSLSSVPFPFSVNPLETGTNTMEQQFLNQQHSATFASPGTPNLEEEVEMIAKGWSSERVPLSNSKKGSRCRHVASSTVALFPFSSGRTLPSKWDDAERWISSPVFGQEGVQSERLAKSKSGPLRPQMLGNYGNYSPVMPVIFGGGSMTTTADSPLLGPSSNSAGYGGRRNSCPGNEQDLASTREWLKLLQDPPGAVSQDADVRSDGVNGEEDRVRRVASRRDMGTQMLPSPSEGSGSSTTGYSPPPEMEDEMVKDVKVDKEDVLPIRRSMNQFPKSISIRSRDYNHDSVTQPRLPTSNEEARINDWENLQREKADAAIQKLEMKLEQRRSSKMEKIMKKLKRAELKAEMMRSSLSETESNGGRNQVGTKTRQRIAGLHRRIRMSSIANCLHCR